MKKNLLLTFVSIAALSNINAQLIVTEEPNDTTFIYSLAGPGIVVSGIERNCAEGASGFFDATSANVGIDNGIVLTSGTLLNVVGPNNLSSATGYNGTAGDDDLTPLTIWETYDACAISFDMNVAADTLKLQFVFGSEEYAEFVGSGFNDVFAFWVSGPGMPDPVNIAVVPGTETPVTINNINIDTNPDYYIYNGDGYSDPYASDPAYVQYDGLTTVMLATIPVTAGETYHMKMIVADAGDAILDSGVFLETGSLGSLRMQYQTLADNDLTNAVEKCAKGYFKLINEVPCADPLVIDYYIAGSAMLPGQITIPAFVSEGIIEINPIPDAVDESLESVVLYLFNPQSGFVYDTLTLLIDDEAAPASFTAENDDLVYTFTETSGIASSVTWEFGDGITSTEMNPTHTYLTEGVYTVCVTSINIYGCSDTYCEEVMVGAVGINNLSNDLTISPNPANNYITVNYSGVISSDLTITIKNVTGTIVSTTTSNAPTTTLDVQSLASGIYFIELNNGGVISVQKIEKL